MANLTSTLTVRLTDDVSGPASKAAGALHKLGASGSDLKKLGGASPEAAKLVRELERLQQASAKLKAFGEASKAFGAAGQDFRTARASVHALTDELGKAKQKLDALKGVRGAQTERESLSNEIGRLQRRLRGATEVLGTTREAFREQGVAVRALRHELVASGVELREYGKRTAGLVDRGVDLAGAQRKVGAAVARTTAQLVTQHGVMDRSLFKTRALTRAGTDAVAAGMGGADNRRQVNARAGARLIDGMGAPARAARASAAAAADVQEERERRRLAAREARGTILGGAGVLAGHAIHERQKEILDVYKEFDDLRRYQVAVADLTPEESDSRVHQARHLGASTRFNDLQVLHAQLDLAQRGVKKEFIEPFIEEIVNYAQAMNTDLGSAAKTLEGIVFSTNQDVESSDTAQKTMRRNVDMAVKLAKIGGLDNEDVKEAFKFGGPSGSVAGLHNETMGAIFALLRRSGFAGSEAGVATRALSAKLVSPTNKGLDALTAMGINYNDYVTMPLGNRPEIAQSAFKRRFGKTFSPALLKQFDDLMNDPDKFGDQGTFIDEASQLTSGFFEKNKKGKMKVTDQKALAKLWSTLWSNIVESVDTERLFGDILKSNPTLAQANAFFTDKHGGKIAVLAKKAELFDEYVAKLQHAPEGFAKGIGDYRNAGYAGAKARLEGSGKNLDSAIGSALDNDGKGGLLTNVTSAAANATQAVAELPGTLLALGAAASWVAGKIGTIAGGALLTGTAAGLGTGIATGSGAAIVAAAGTAAGVVAPVVATAAVGAALIAADKSKAIAHGGKDVSGRLDASDELPGLGRDYDVRAGIKGGGSLPPGAAQPASRAAEGVRSLIDAPVTPKVDTAPLDQLGQKAEEAKGKLEQVGATSVTPKVDASPLDALIAKAQEALSALLRIPGAVSAANGAIASVPSGGGNTGAVRRAVSDNH